jgi:Phage integrase central domain/Arm DNA-binding domain
VGIPPLFTGFVEAEKGYGRYLADGVRLRAVPAGISVSRDHHQKQAPQPFSSLLVSDCTRASHVIVYARVLADGVFRWVKLTATKLRTLVKPGTYGDGEGLYLQVRGPRNRSWLFRYKLNRKSRLMGLGRVEDVTLAQAREAAQAARRLLRQGIDPIDKRRSERSSAGLNTFREVAEAYIKAHSPGWRNAKHREQWRRTLESYAYPVLGSLGVSTIDTGAVMRVLEPIWRAKPETAGRLRGRIEAVLDYASANCWRNGDNPARLRGHLAKLLPPRSKIAPVEHHAALPWQQLGEFMHELRQQTSVSALSLRFTILTAARKRSRRGGRGSHPRQGTAPRPISAPMNARTASLSTLFPGW